MKKVLVAALLLGLAADAGAQAEVQVDARLEQKVIEWRRDIHANPELGNREFRTAKLVADHLRGLGIEVRTGVAHTGVVGLLKGGKPGPVVAQASSRPRKARRRARRAARASW